jgi:hypothetical protein
MDLNYLFYRQQVERSRANSAKSETARNAHLELAIEYEKRIRRASGDRDSDAVSNVNPTMAVAITARQVDQS